MSLKHDSAKKLRKEKSKWHTSSAEEFEQMEDTFLKERLLHKEPTITGQVRIAGGTAKNFKIDIPKTTRPMTDRMKVRVFDVLSKDIANKTILDLYAGAGSFGLEALSRGAKFATFIDASRSAEGILNDNIAHTGFLPQAEVIKAKVEEYLYKEVVGKQEAGEKLSHFDIIFMDPPYKLYNTKNTYKMNNVINLSSKLLLGVQDPKTRKFKGALIMKHPRRYPLENLKLDDIKPVETYEFGLNAITFFIVK
jgi:16S rRNA (guanine(966)-N(2))-methyltransferase RsmD